MSQTRIAKVKEAIQKIREFYTFGKKLPHKASYGEGTVKDIAEKYETNQDDIRKARKFADPKKGYTKDELEELCSLILTEQSKTSGAIFGRTHLIRMLSVPKSERSQFQKRAIESGWSTGQLESQIKIQFGSRHDGGRKRKVPSDLKETLGQLEGLCESWRRWVGSVLHLKSNSEASRTDSHVELPEELIKLIQRTTKAMTTLHATVNRELNKDKTDYENRKQFREKKVSK